MHLSGINSHNGTCIGIIHDKVSDSDCTDISAFGILNTRNGRNYIRIDIGLLKRKVAVDHPAVYKLQSLAVTQGLGSGYRTVYEGHILTVPAKVFSFDDTVFNDYILCMPERIAKIKETIFNGYVPALLKCTLTVCRTVKLKSYGLDITASVKSPLLIKYLIFDYLLEPLLKILPVE